MCPVRLAEPSNAHARFQNSMDHGSHRADQPIPHRHTRPHRHTAAARRRSIFLVDSLKANTAHEEDSLTFPCLFHGGQGISLLLAFHRRLPLHALMCPAIPRPTTSRHLGHWPLVSGNTATGGGSTTDATGRDSSAYFWRRLMAVFPYRV